MRIKIAIETNGHHIQLRLGGGAQAPSEMNEIKKAHLDGQKRSIEGPFRAIVWLVCEVSKPQPGIKMVCGGTECNQSDVVNPRQKSLVTNIRGPALPRNDQNCHLPKFKNLVFLSRLDCHTSFTQPFS